MREQGTNGQSGRGSTWKLNLTLYVVGAILLFIGVRVATEERINLLTGQSSYPHLGVGIVLVVVGLVLALVARFIATKIT